MTTTIRHGDAGPAVRDVQERLRRLLGLVAPVDGRFRSETDHAVRAFQRQRGLLADGVVGPQTWQALVEAGYQLGDRLLWHAATPPQGDDVRDLQHRLNQLGFDAGPEDGIFGPLAHAAVEEFQRNVGLDVDGVAGPRTVAALRRLRRDHQSGGVGVRAREREWLRQLVARGFNSARVFLDPAHGPDDPGAVGPRGARAHEVTWEIARRLAARLAAGGSHVTLSRGPTTTPSPSTRARLANQLGADVVVSIGIGSHHNPAARGASAFYFGAPHFRSDTGRRLAEQLHDAVLPLGQGPDNRVHPMDWPVLRETRMPAVICEPAFLTNPDEERRLVDPAGQDALAGALADAMAQFFDRAAA